MIGQYIGGKLVAQVIISQLMEQREIDNHFNYLMLHRKMYHSRMQQLQKCTTPECSNLKPQAFHLFPSAIWKDLAETFAGLSWSYSCTYRQLGPQLGLNFLRWTHFHVWWLVLVIGGLCVCSKLALASSHNDHLLRHEWKLQRAS